MTMNNPSTLAAAAKANLDTGFLLLCKEALITAIQDRRLERGHLRVLAAVATFMSSLTAKAWPGRAAIAEVTGMSLKTVSNTLLELRSFGYLIADREAVEEANNRRLMVYTFGNIDHATIRAEITAWVQQVRDGKADFAKSKVPAHGEVESPRPRGTSPPTGNSAESKVPAHGEVSPEKSPPTGDSNSKKDNTAQPSGAGPATQAPRKRDAIVKPRTKLPRDWTPAPETIAWAKANYVATDQQVALEAEKFHSHHYGKGNAMADWPAAWRTWWFNGYHKIPRRMDAVAAMSIAASAGQNESFYEALERARRLEEEDEQCRP